MRYVVLHHVFPPGHERPSHWDFMLEQGDVLWTWSLEEEPAQGKAIVARRLVDHRRAYLDYQGPISGDRGEVVRWDAGGFTVSDDQPARWEITCAGEKLNGRVRFERSPDSTDGWLVSVMP